MNDPITEGIVPGQLPAMADTLSRMERDGLIRRTRHPIRCPRQQIRLTAKSRSIKQAAHVAAMLQNGQDLSKLSAAEQFQFIDLMNRVIAAMQSDDPEASAQ